ncbi:hypothetical protein ACFL96_13445 [Thermoproteota archaeon]
MAYTVEPSFNYAEFCVDYKTKDIKLNYPAKNSKSLDFWMFFVVGMIPCVLITFLISFIFYLFVGDIVMWGMTYSYEYLGLFIFAVTMVIWLLWAYNGSSLRKMLIEMGKSNNYNNQAYLSGITGKRFKITNAGNFFTEYKLYGDYKKFIEKFEIKCAKYEKVKGVLGGNKYVWELHFVFSQLPKKGHMIVYNERGDSDEIIGDNAIDVVYY